MTPVGQRARIAVLRRGDNGFRTGLFPIAAGEAGAGEKAFDAVRFAAVAGLRRAIALRSIARQRIMPPLARGTVTADMGAPAERHARTGQTPRVYFEEWDEPLISGILWASELIEIAGGENIFADRARSPLAKDRKPTGAEVIAAAPDIIIGSWCGKHFRPERIAARPGWENIPAVRDGRLHEIKSAVILTPGPVAISEGLPALLDIFDLSKYPAPTHGL